MFGEQSRPQTGVASADDGEVGLDLSCEGGVGSGLAGSSSQKGNNFTSAIARRLSGRGVVEKNMKSPVSRLAHFKRQGHRVGLVLTGNQRKRQMQFSVHHLGSRLELYVMNAQNLVYFAT